MIIFMAHGGTHVINTATPEVKQIGGYCCIGWANEGVDPLQSTCADVVYEMDDVYDLAFKINQQTTNDTLAEFCIYLADAAGVEAIEGIPPGDWFVKRKKENLDKALMKLEDLDPAAAAKVQKLINDSRNKKPD